MKSRNLKNVPPTPDLGKYITVDRPFYRKNAMINDIFAQK
jgi:hypothetical protein